jgi:glycosyltransferase involved in cell wall biosynthesis
MKRIVIVARHFPPAVSGGARRPYLLAKALLNAGWDVAVLAPQACPEIPVVPVPHHHVDPPLETPQQPGLRDRLRSFILLPDPDVRWAISAARTPLPFIPDWVLTTSPPESAHVAGWIMRRRYRCHWAVELRDHWLMHPLRAERVGSRWRQSLERSLARWLLASADTAVAVTTSIRAELADLAPSLACNVIGHFADPPPDGRTLGLDPGDVHIVHTGSFVLSDPGRRLEGILAAFEQALAQNPRLRLHLVGRLRQDEIVVVRSSPASSRIGLVGTVPLAEARIWQTAADALLLAAAPATPHIPGKLAEYRAASKPIIVTGGGSWLAEAGLLPPEDLASAMAAARKAPVENAAPEPERTGGGEQEFVEILASYLQ